MSKMKIVPASAIDCTDVLSGAVASAYSTAEQQLSKTEDVPGMAEVLKANPYRDASGRFASADDDVQGQDTEPPSTPVEALPGLGLKRKDMPQIQSADMPEFFQYARTNGVAVHSGEAEVMDLRPSQSEYNAEHASKLTEESLRKPITISKDLYVLDGHNRWARLKNERAGKVRVNQIALAVHDALKLMHDFPKSFRKDVQDVGATKKLDKPEDCATLQAWDFALILKENPYRDEFGKFTDKEHAVNPGSGDRPSAGGRTPDDRPDSGPKEVRYVQYDGSDQSATALAESAGSPPTLDEFYSEIDPEIRREIEAKVSEVKTLKTTDELHKTADGKWTKERTALHKRIIKDLFTPEMLKSAKPAPGEKPTVVILGGRGGSGKSAFTTPTEKGGLGLFDRSKFVVLDSDAIKERLPEYKGWNAWQVHEESSHIFDLASEMAQKLGLNMVHDVTMKSGGPGSALEKKVKNYWKAGYEVKGAYMFLPGKIAAKRAVDRYVRGKASGTGRLVPPEVPMHQNVNNERNFDYMKQYFSSWSVYRNDGAKPEEVKSWRKKS